MAGSVISAPASSIRHPRDRSARWPRRRRPSRSADAGSCSRPAATACAGRSRSARVRRCAAAAVRCGRNPDIEKTLVKNPATIAHNFFVPRQLVLTSTLKKRRLYEDFLSRCPILDTLTSYEKSTLADALVSSSHATLSIRVVNVGGSSEPRGANVKR